MSLKTAGVAALTTLVLGAPASLHANTTAEDCPAATANAARMQTLDQQIERLSAQLDALDETLQAQTDARNAALSEAESRIQDAVHQDWNPEQIDAAVTRAVAEANARAEATARAAIGLHNAMEAVRTQLHDLDRQLHAMAEAPTEPEPEPPTG